MIRKHLNGFIVAIALCLIVCGTAPLVAEASSTTVNCETEATADGKKECSSDTAGQSCTKCYFWSGTCQLNTAETLCVCK